MLTTVFLGLYVTDSIVTFFLKGIKPFGSLFSYISIAVVFSLFLFVFFFAAVNYPQILTLLEISAVLRKGS